jgi:glycosyltransferase involved in cell wall biosynthesis
MMPIKPPLISIIVCVFNEELALNAFFSRLLPILEKHVQDDYEVICVDDGSTDGSLSLLMEMAKINTRLRVIELSRNFGKEAALTAGIEYAAGQAVIPIDADLQDPPELIADMLTEWEKGADVVLARRSNRDSDSLLKRKTSQWFYRLYNKLSSTHLPDNVGDFRLIDRRVVNAICALPERQRFMKGIFAWVGFKTVTIDYTRAPRVSGKTKFTGWKLWNFALEGITSFTTIPLRIWTYIGLIGAFLSALYAGFIIFRTLISGVDVPGYASLLVAVLFMGSMQLVSVGLIGEYIGRLYVEAKRRPIFIVRRTIGFNTDLSDFDTNLTKSGEHES